jgi:glutamate dehydrogenase (NAD(P)+)
VLVPAALQDVIDSDIATRLRARLVVEGANLPTSPDAQRILAERGITVVPDFIANAGGVVAAGFAMEARYSPFRPEPAQIFSLISAKLRGNTETVLAHARTRNIRPHEAARQIAQERVHAAMRLKGRISRGAS